MYITNYQIRNDKVIIYEEWQGYSSAPQHTINRSENLKKQRKKAYSGTLTKGGKKRLEKAITLICQASPVKYIYNPIINRHHYHKLSFVTLTVSDSNTNHTAKDAYEKLLRPLIQWLTKYKGVKLYIWKAELQKRGQIHYHLITPTWINYQELRNKWNYLQLKAGFLEGYYEKYKSYDPNSTDIHSMRKIKDAAAYLTKYLSKEQVKKPNDENEHKPETAKTTGKVWDCSKTLKTTNYFTIEASQDFADNLKTAVDQGKAYYKTFDHFTIVFLINIKVTELLPLHHLMKMQQYMNTLNLKAAA